MANILENIKDHGLAGGLVEAARDAFGKGKYQGAAQFHVIDENGDKTEVSNSAATPIYKTPTGFSNTRSYAYLTQGDNGKLTLNYSSDLANSDAFRKNYLDNDAFKEVVRSYNANTNADTVIQTKNEDGTVENVKFSDLINNYNTALNEFASNYEGFSLVRDNFKNNTGFDLSDEEIRIATNTINDDDKKSETKAIFLPQEWLSIYDFSKLPSFDEETKTVSAKDFFEAYDLDKDGGINEEAWNEMIGSANGIVANAYSGNMKKNVDEDAEGDEEAIATAKDRLVRAYSASNLLANHDPEQSFLHTVGIVSSNAVLTLGNNVSQVVGKFATLEGAVIDSVTYFGELGIAAIKDKSIQMATLQGAVAEDFQSGAVTPNNFNEYIDGILVSSTDGSMSEVEKVKAEWQAKIKGKQTLADLSYAEGTTFRDMQDAVDWQIAYTAEIAPVAAQAGAIMGEFAFLALEVAVANGLGSSTGALVSSEAGTVKALSTAFKSTSTLTRLKSLASFAARNKAVSFSANMMTQAMVDTFVFEDTDTFLNAWARLDPGAQKELSRAFTDNLVGNSVAEVIGIGSSAIGGKLAASNNKGVLWIRSRAAKAAAWASLPKKKAQAAFAGTKMAQLLSKPIGKSARQASDMFIKAVNEGSGTVFKAKTLEEYNVEKFQMEYSATKNIANAKAGDVIVTDFEKNTTKVSETTTEAILGKVAEKSNFLNQAARIAEGVKATTDSIVADETVGAAYKGVTDGAVELQKTLKWKDFNPAMGKYLSQDASNYVANKVHFDDLTRKKGILEAEKKALSPLEQKKLEDLSNWLKEFAVTHNDDAMDALNLFIEKQQALNKALTDWQVRNGIMTKATYDSLAGTGYYGANDEFYVKTVAIPNGKTMEELDEEVNASIYVETQRDFLDGAGVRGANYVYKQDMHLSNSIDSNYLDPVLVNSLTIDNIAKAYQGRMWYNSMVAIKAPTREIDVTGKPVKKREIENVMKHARNSAEEAIDSVSLKELGEGTLGKTFQESSTTIVKGKGKDRVEINKVDKYQEKVNRKLGIADDKQIATNVGILDESQTKTVIATFGDEAPAYGKCKTNEELKAVFEGLSEKQQEQALKAMGKNPVETKKTVTTQKKNPEYAAWKKEKTAFEKEQAKAKKAFDKEQAKLAKQSTKKTSTKFPKEAKKQLEKDMRDAILYDSNTDIKSWKELSTDDVNAKLTDARKKEIGDILKDDFDIDKFRELDNPKIEDAIKPEYIEQVRAKYGGKDVENIVSQSPVKVLDAGEPYERRVKTVKLDYIENDIDASIADSVQKLNDAGLHVNNASSGLVADAPGKDEWLNRGAGYIEFDEQAISKADYDAIRNAANKAGLCIEKSGISIKGETSFSVSMNVTKDGESASELYRNAGREMAKKYGIEYGPYLDMMRKLEEKGVLSEAMDFREKAFERRLKEHGGYAFGGDEAKIKAWNTFFDELGISSPKTSISSTTSSVFEEKGPVIDGHDFRTEDASDGYQKFLHDNTSIKTHGDSEPVSKAANIAAEHIVTPGGFVDEINQELRSGELDIGKVGDETSEEWSRLLDHYINPDTVALNYYGNGYMLADEFGGPIDETDLYNMYRELTGKKPAETGIELDIEDRIKLYKAIKEKLDDNVMDALRTGNRELSEDTILYRVLSNEGNFVGKGDMSWLNKSEGEYLDKGFGFVTLDENKVLNNATLTNPKGNKYVLRIHAPKGTGIFGFDGSVIVENNSGAMMFSGANAIVSSGHRAGGEMALTPGQKGKFVKSGEKIGDAEYVDVYLDGWDRPIRPVAKIFDKPAPDEFITETSTKVESSKVKAIDEPGALRAWNQAVANTSMVDDLNKTFIAERVNPAEGGPKKMTEATKKTLTNAIAEKTKYNFSPESVSVEGKTMDDLVEEYTKKGNKENAYNEAVKKLEDAQAMEKAVAEGTDPFSLSTMEFGESVIEIGAYRLKNSAVGADLAKKASEYGIEDDSIFEYYVLSSMVENAPDGTIRLSKKFKRAFEDKYEARFLKAPNSEGQMNQLGLKKLMNDAEEKIERLVVGRWASYQNDLVERGATDLIDTNKYFDAIEGEMKKIAGDISGNRNIIQVLDASGEYKYVEVDPIVADLYRSRPYNNRDNDSFIRKLSRLSRLGKTSLNPVSVMNQNFKDAIQSFVMAGWAHSVTTYSKEIAEMFGDQFVNYLRESMGEEGWLKFSEGLTDSEARLKATELMTTGKMGAEPFVGNLTSRQLFRKNAPQEDLAGQIRNEAAEAYSYLGGYTKKKGLSAKKNAKKGLIDAIEDISPGGAINNWRETYFRKANYTSAMNDALKRGETLSQARATAEFVSRNATTNFRNTFMWGNILCDNVPFLSAAINGSASFWRLFEMDPVGVLTRINASGIAVIAQVISSGQSLEDRNTLKNVPDWVKRSGAVFIVNGSVYTIPLPEEIAIFLAPFRQTAEKMLGSEDRSWVELLYNDALEISPINLDGFSTDDQSKLTKNQGLLSRLGRQIQVLLSQVSPPIVKTAIMARTGIDPYTGNEIDNSYVWYDEDGNRQIMDYTTSETARGLANISKKFNWNVSPSMAQALFEEALGTGFLQMSDDVVNLYEAFFSGKNIDGENIDRTKTAFSPITSAVENAASSVVVEDYQIKDKYDKDFKALITSLERKKNELLTPGSIYMDTIEQMSKLKATDGNYDTKKQNLTQQAMQEIENFRKDALFAVNTYVNHYGSDYDDKKFASVVALLNFNNPTGVIPTSAKDFQDSQSAYYRGREDAYQTMIDLGFKSVNDYSILGIAKRNSQTGEIYTRFNSPVAILNARKSVFNGMAENVNAEIAAALEVAGIDRKDMFAGYYNAKAQGKAAAKQYKKDWNAKVVKAIAPTVNQYGADNVLSNSTVQDYLDRYIFISNPYKTGDYLKEIFEVED